MAGVIEEPIRRLLADFIRIATKVGVEYHVVGATARILVFEGGGRRGGRTTKDMDVGVRVASWEEYATLEQALVGGDRPTFSRTSAEHRFRHGDGGLLDVVPHGRVECPDGRIDWPKSAQRMSVLGFDDSLAASEDVVLDGIAVRVATGPAQAVLKLNAYLDRRDRGTTHDLEDFDFMLRTYGDLPGVERRIYDEAGERIRDGILEVADAGAWLLGCDAGKLFAERTLRRIAAELVDVGPYDPIIDERVPRGLTDADDRRKRQEAVQRFRAFRDGLFPG